MLRGRGTETRTVACSNYYVEYIFTPTASDRDAGKRRNESRDDKRKRERAERNEAAGGRNRRM